MAENKSANPPATDNSGGYTPTTTSPAAGPAATTDPFASTFSVYSGATSVSTNKIQMGDEYPHPVTTKTRQQVGAEDALKAALTGKTPSQIKAIQQQLDKAGYSVEVTGTLDPKTITAYQQLLQDTYEINQLTGNTISPEEFLAQKISGVTAAGSGAGKSHTSTSTSYSSAADASTIAQQTFVSKLGRRPKPGELSAFVQALQAYEAANPSVSTETTDAGGNINTTTTGGADPQTFASNYVNGNYSGQVGAHDALHYFDLIASALTGPPGGVQHVA